MNKLDEAATYNSTDPQSRSNAGFIYSKREQVNGSYGQVPEQYTLRQSVEHSLRRYFKNLDNEPATDLYQMVLREVEAPLLETVMRYTGNNQSKASILLGLNRGTLRTKLKNYGML
ncbi:MAG: DNA-binding transcriptional regulator Fis [Gammaproteobacteria bacterium]|nr:DNA-binding transcriptional regulator Fis [Gammaproteobacteria bacterium]MCY4356294.1 DNA-binding transcriptional regulator Fis [Gammaproteobacteria bacterium]